MVSLLPALLSDFIIWLYGPGGFIPWPGAGAMPLRPAIFDGFGIPELYGILIMLTPSSAGGGYGGLLIGGNLLPPTGNPCTSVAG